jgi:Tat protein secretion system quality control protein TatD with DNase activity
LKEVIRQIDLKWLLTDSDRENPEGVVAVAEKIAEVKGLTRDAVGLATTKNLKKLIRL